MILTDTKFTAIAVQLGAKISPCIRGADAAQERYIARYSFGELNIYLGQNLYKSVRIPAPLIKRILAKQ